MKLYIQIILIGLIGFGCNGNKRAKTKMEVQNEEVNEKYKVQSILITHYQRLGTVGFRFRVRVGVRQSLKSIKNHKNPYLAFMEKTNYNILNNYWGLIKGLKIAWQLDLIEMLTRSVRKNLKKSPNKMKLAFGAWESDQSADEIIEKIRSSCKFNSQREVL